MSVCWSAFIISISTQPNFSTILHVWDPSNGGNVEAFSSFQLHQMGASLKNRSGVKSCGWTMMGAARLLITAADVRSVYITIGKFLVCTFYLAPDEDGESFFV